MHSRGCRKGPGWTLPQRHTSNSPRKLFCLLERSSEFPPTSSRASSRRSRGKHHAATSSPNTAKHLKVRVRSNRTSVWFDEEHYWKWAAQQERLQIELQQREVSFRQELLEVWQGQTGAAWPLPAVGGKREEVGSDSERRRRPSKIKKRPVSVLFHKLSCLNPKYEGKENDGNGNFKNSHRGRKRWRLILDVIIMLTFNFSKHSSYCLLFLTIWNKTNSTIPK